MRRARVCAHAFLPPVVQVAHPHHVVEGRQHVHMLRGVQLEAAHDVAVVRVAGAANGKGTCILKKIKSNGRNGCRYRTQNGCQQCARRPGFVSYPRVKGDGGANVKWTCWRQPLVQGWKGCTRVGVCLSVL